MWSWNKRPWPSREESRIGSGMRIRGPIDSDGRLRIAGEVEGDICHRGLLIIEPGATCTGNIRAVEMLIAGEVRGNVQVENTLELAATARLFGETQCGSLRIAPGALFIGTNRMAGEPDLLPATVEHSAARALPEGPLAILSEPLETREHEVLVFHEQEAPRPLAVAPAPATVSDDLPAFYGGFSPAFRTTGS